MTFIPPVSAGTINLANGSTTVSGLGTNFLSAGAKGGDILVIGVTRVEIQEVVSNTTIELLLPWNDADIAGGDFYIVSRNAETLAAENSAEVRRLLLSIRTGLLSRPDAFGTLAERSQFDNEPSGFIYHEPDEATGEVLAYYKLGDTASDWSSGFTFRGEQGLQGPQGIQGIQGIQGEKGDTGANGAAFTHTLAGAPSNSLGNDGDTYLDTLTLDTYVNVSGSWNLGESLRGEEGPQGERGEQGEQGIQGEQGDGLEINQFGNLAGRDAFDGEARGFSYLDENSGLLYFKQSDATGDWTSGTPFTNTSAINEVSNLGFWVDQQFGDDAQEGTADAPLQTIQQAIDLAVFNGRVQINLIGDYELTENVLTRGRYVHIRSASVASPSRLTFMRSLLNNTSNTRRQLARFIPNDNGEISFSRIIYVIPDTVGFSGGARSSVSHTISGFSSLRDSFLSVFFSSCTIEIPADSFGSVIGWTQGLWVGVINCTFPNQSARGNLLSTHTDVNGTDPNTITRLITNLSLV